MTILLMYLANFVSAYFVVHKITQTARPKDYASLKTVTFGDESAVRPNRIAGIISVLTIFLLRAIFTGSSLIPSFLHAPGPFKGDASFDYTLQAGNETDDATVSVLVHERDESPAVP